MSTRALRVGLAGYGFGGRVFHAPLIRSTDGLRLSAIYSPSEATRERARVEHPGVSSPGCFAELLEHQLDLVVISTPHDTHADLAVAALEAGKHVVVDKVMCLTPEDGRRMLDAARRAGRLLTVYQNRRWDGDFLTVRELQSSGALGDPLVVEARWTRPSLSRRSSWRLERSRGGGMWLDLGAHLVDQLLLLLGEVESVYCTQLHTLPECDVPTYTECSLRFRSGALGIVEVSAITPLERPRWLVRGTDACFEKHGLDPQEARLIQGIVGWPDPDPGPHGRLARERNGSVVIEEVATVPGDWGAFYRNVRDAMRGEAELAVRPEECLRVLDVLLAAERSAAECVAVRP